jgi:hypothetical protein
LYKSIEDSIFDVSVSPQDIDVEEEDPPAEFLSWNERSISIRHKLNMPADSMPWVDEHRLAGLPSGARFRDCVAVAYHAYLQGGGDPNDPAPLWNVDVSQNVDRCSWSAKPMAFTKSSVIYSFALDRCLDSEDRPRHQSFQH